MNFSKAFGCGKISPSSRDGTAEENFMQGLEAVQKHGDNVEWKDVVKHYLRAANKVSGRDLGLEERKEEKKKKRSSL